MTLYGATPKSAEHLFQFAKVMRCGNQNATAQTQSATDALSAKRIGDKVKTKKQWKDTCEKVMTEVVSNRADLNKLNNRRRALNNATD